MTKAFGELEVLKGVDLEVAEHEAVALIGASGSGKSTLLRCIDLLEDIDDGDIFLDGDVITDPSVNAVEVRRRLGVVFQAYNLFPHLERDGERDARAGSAPATSAAPRPRSRRSSSWPDSASRGASTSARTTSPAASSNASRSCARSPPGPARCSSTR